MYVPVQHEEEQIGDGEVGGDVIEVDEAHEQDFAG